MHLTTIIKLLAAFACLPYLVRADDGVAEQDIDKIEWWKKTNFYHIYIRSFRDSDGDGEGDLRGVVEKLDYLHFIGVDTLLLSPFYSSPMKDIGYDIDDYTAVSPKFGTMRDFEDLVEGLKRRGMHLVVDFVPNHSSNKHKWFECSERAFVEPERCGKYKDYYVWSGSKRFNNSYPSNWTSVFGGGPAWTWSPIRKQFYLHQFLPEQPDLNMTNPLVREELREVIRFWLRKGADGIRVDALPHIFEHTEMGKFPDEPENPSWTPDQYPYERLLHIHTRGLPESSVIVGEWRDVVREPEFTSESQPGQNTERLIITEGYVPLDILLLTYGRSASERYADMPFNFHLVNLTKADLGPKTLRDVVGGWIDLLTTELNWPDEGGAMSPWTCWVTGNHDNQRLVNRVGDQNLQIFKWISYLAPGVPVNYYGDELGMKDSDFNEIPKRTMDEGEPTRLVFRAPMAWTSEDPAGGFSSTSDIWLPLNDDYKINNVQSRLQEQTKNHLNNFIALQRLRQNKLDLFVFGDLILYPDHPVASSKIFSLARTHNKFGNLLLIANFNAQSELVNLLPTDTTKIWKRPAPAPPARGKVLLVNYVDGQNPTLIEGAEVEIEGLVLAPHQVVLLEY